MKRRNEKAQAIWRNIEALERDIEAKEFVIGLLKMEQDASTDCANDTAREASFCRGASPADGFRCVHFSF